MKIEQLPFEIILDICEYLTLEEYDAIIRTSFLFYDRQLYQKKLQKLATEFVGNGNFDNPKYYVQTMVPTENRLIKIRGLDCFIEFSPIGNGRIKYFCNRDGEIEYGYHKFKIKRRGEGKYEYELTRDDKELIAVQCYDRLYKIVPFVKEDVIEKIRTQHNLEGVEFKVHYRWMRVCNYYEYNSLFTF